MDLLSGYNSVSSEEGGAPTVEPAVRRTDRKYLNAAPTPSLLAGRTRRDPSVSSSTALVTRQTKHQKSEEGSLLLMNNPKKSTLYHPVQGPQAMDPQLASSSLAKAGATEANVTFDETTFHEQRKAFQRTGQALAPNDDGTVVARTFYGYDQNRVEWFQEKEEKRQQAREEKRKRRRQEGDDTFVHGSDDEATYGVWAPPSLEERMASENQLSDIARGGVESLAPQQLAEREYIKERDRQLGEEKEDEVQSTERSSEWRMRHLLPPQKQSAEACEPKTTFHADEEFDYRGRSWIEPPAGYGSVAGSSEEVDTDHHRCFIPKRCVHRFTGHKKGVQRIRLFPRTGHLLLSAGLDGTCKVWSTVEKTLMRTYVGHTQGVRDVQFNHDGSRFVSASFDRYLRMWNTETGEVFGTYSNGAVPYVVQFYPRDDNLFVVGCSNNKIVTFDATTKEITQEYNHHLAPVNALCFFENEGIKMITSSDDKKMLVWEWDIGVPIKYISDPTMHSVVSMTLHPDGEYVAGQSLDNAIKFLRCRGSISQKGGKALRGHQVSGYACDVCFSPDGEFAVSGDGNGKVFFWGWQKRSMLRKYEAHNNGPTMGCAWHPLEPSVVFTCGWDGVVKMWR